MGPDHFAAHAGAGGFEDFGAAGLLVSLPRQICQDQLTQFIEQNPVRAGLDGKKSAGARGGSQYCGSGPQAGPGGRIKTTQFTIGIAAKVFAS